MQTDFEKLVLQNNAGLLALKKNELDAYDQIAEGKLNKQELRKFVNNDQEREAARIAEQIRAKNAKEYPEYIKNPAFNEFWDDIKRTQKPPSRPQSAPRDSRENMDDDSRQRKKFTSMLP